MLTTVAPHYATARNVKSVGLRKFQAGKASQTSFVALTSIIQVRDS